MKEGNLFPFFRSCSFHIKNKLKSEIFNDKNNYEQKSLSVKDKNLNWEPLTTNLLTFKRWYYKRW